MYAMGHMRIGRLSEVVIGRCHRDSAAQLRRAPEGQRIAHHRSEAEARGEDPAVVDAQVRVDEGEQVVEEDNVSVVIPGKVADTPGRYEDGGLVRRGRFAVEPEIGIVFCVEVGTIIGGM